MDPRDEAAALAKMSRDEFAVMVQQRRKAQGLPPYVTNPTTLQRVADLMRSAEKRSRRRRTAS